MKKGGVITSSPYLPYYSKTGGPMSVGKVEPKNPHAADYKIYARLDAGESLESIIANPPTTKFGSLTCESNIRQEYGFWIRWRKKNPKP